jgi:hypothetical protein
MREECMILFEKCACFHFQALRELNEVLRVRSSVLNNCKKNSKRLFLLEVHDSHSLSKSCRI